MWRKERVSNAFFERLRALTEATPVAEKREKNAFRNGGSVWYCTRPLCRSSNAFKDVPYSLAWIDTVRIAC
jgi:hypothetical protein